MNLMGWPQLHSLCAIMSPMSLVHIREDDSLGINQNFQWIERHSNGFSQDAYDEPGSEQVNSPVLSCPCVCLNSTVLQAAVDYSWKTQEKDSIQKPRET